MDNFENFFTKNGTMICCVVAALICFALSIGFNAAYSAMTFDFETILLPLIVFLCINTLYSTFRSHNTKGMLIISGALLMTLLVLAISNAQSYINLVTAGFDFLNMLIVLIGAIVEAILFTVLFVNHYKINTSHGTAHEAISTNKILLVILFFIQLFNIFVILAPRGLSSSLIIPSVTECIGKIFIFGLVICTEAKLNEYKAVRENAINDGTWDEEKKEQVKKDVFGD